MAMHLSKLLENIVKVKPDEDREITGLSLDSRTTKPGDLFFAYPGTAIDGRDFIAAAIEQGAVAILAEVDENPPALQKAARRPPFSKGVTDSVPLFAIPNLATHVGSVAARFYHHPSHHMQVVGITGTNGKTSCCHFIGQALHNDNKTCGIIGTVGNGLAGSPLQHASLTTPDPISLQALLAEWQQQGVQYVAMEAASHGLAQGRVNGIEFTTAVFTNLTRDHLDYHGDMASYAAAKRLLFARPGLRNAVLNIDDLYGQQWLEELTGKLEVFAYSIDAVKNKCQVPLVYAQHAKFAEIGITASVHTPWGDGVLHNPYLIGRFNLSNLLAALTVLGISGMPLPTILARLTEVKSVPGRMQVVGGGAKPLAVIDYSHTPDALEQALKTLREHCQRKLWCVFGCGGDRDRGKRPLMGKLAEQYADYIVVTDDNPRHEEPRQIVAEILQGLDNPAGAVVEHDRRRAITHALSSAQVNDVVLIAGKGHETYQIIGDKKLVFNDVLEAQLILNELG